MGIVNKRNAVLGWLTWSALKHLAKSKALSAAPRVEDGRPNRAAKGAAAAAAAGGVLVVWRRKKRHGAGGDDAGFGDGADA